ncbi:hypothetical protein AC579_1238 [Pseudocercospora musae]|uniref:Uncharacterized protein n=1 Tax=Pseudocercospora musae TaxID=113226 RepID=A0A139I5N5_9PEZI|nr:hypothetical protein AC579_1238 [Pseudocercospora musae]
MVVAATATALTGALVTSVFVGRSMGRSLQEKKVKSGLLDTSAGKLGNVLKSWNEQDWKDLGLFMHLELSESAMKRKEQKSRSFRKPSNLYSSREDRERKQEERKFCIVVTRLDEEGLPADAIHDIAESDLAAEMDSKEPIYEIPELHGDDEMPVELPAEVPAETLGARREADISPGVAELPFPVGELEKDLDAERGP